MKKILAILAAASLAVAASAQGTNHGDGGHDAQIKSLYEKADELDLKVILILENSSDSIAKSIRAGSTSQDQEILVLDSLQSVTQKDYENGRTYLSAMEKNLETLGRALAA